MIKLLLADDSITIQRVVELTFSGEDVQVIAVSDGEQAIARLPVERPDIVLADIGMPKRDGYEVSAFVKGHPDLSHIPVLLLAGAFEPVDESRAKEVKCDGVLIKPFEPQQVIARVRELVNEGKPAATHVVTEAPRRVMTEPPPSVERAAPKAEPAPPLEPDLRSEAPGQDLDDYFDRLDAAFATLGGAPSSDERPPASDPFAERDIPTVDDVLGDATQRLQAPSPMDFGRVTRPPVEPPDVSPTLTAAPRLQAARPSEPQRPVVGRNAIAEVFSILFAAEQGDTEALRRFQVPASQPVITDDLVDQVTRRVLERLAPDTARDLVAEIVSEVAERLVREEITRIRHQSGE